MSSRSQMSLRKLEKSLLLRVEERLKELLPDAQVRGGRHSIRIKAGGLEGEVPVTGLAELCMQEERSNWGAIAGGFCNLVESRVHAWADGPLRDSAELARVFPAVLPDSADDRLIDDAAVTPALLIASLPWLEGLRVEFEHHGDGAFRRLFQRDLDALGLNAEEVGAYARANMASIISKVEVRPASASGPGAAVFTARSEGVAPAMTWAESGQRLFFDTLEAAGENPTKVLACAPRSDRVFFCSIRNKEAASEMVSQAWRSYEQNSGTSVPLSPRLYTISAPGQVKFLDVGIPPDRVSAWTHHALGFASVCVPNDWWVSEHDGRHVIWRSDDSPRIRVRMVDSGGGSPLASRELADRVRSKHQTTTATGHGFFNGLPWSWVDTGFHEGFATASMFVVFPEGLAIVQTEIPEGAAPADQVTLQKIIATIRRSS